jgi:peptidoglycan/xylan/chitin deacetylase (PgdA/CDA1 family)
MRPQELLPRVRRFYHRSSARFLFKRQLLIKSSIPLISFTFDDFPKSAWQTGGAILKSYGLAGTFFASLGLIGTQARMGRMFDREDLSELLEQGHELGCHTFAHSDAGETKASVFEDSILKNREELQQLKVPASFRTFSYPISVPRPWSKLRASRYFDCCRGGGQNFNAGTADLNYLNAYFLEKSSSRPEAVKEIIDRNGTARGWLVFATHDICAQPSPFGCSPAFFDDIVRYSLASGAKVLPLVEALDLLRASSRQQ